MIVCRKKKGTSEYKNFDSQFLTNLLIQNIKDLMVSRHFTLLHSLREGNKCPDFMAKLGVSNDVKLSIHSSPPEDLLPLLRTDELGVCFLRR